jgi:excisionase family DNA binding protein
MARREEFLEAYWIDPTYPDFTKDRKLTKQSDTPAAPEEAVFNIRDRIGFRYERRVGLGDFVSQREAARLLGVAVMTVYRWVRNKELRSEARNGYSVIKLRDLVRFATARELLNSNDFRTRMPIALQDDALSDPNFSGFTSNLSSQEHMYVHFDQNKKSTRGRSRKSSR